jgi:hypothetical protein
METPEKLALARGSNSLEVTKELWAEALLLAQKYGWMPDRLSYNYLACNEPISDEVANGIKP